MDAEDFKTLGECEFGTIWEVQSENKIVVNAYQAALYFSREDFLHFARMVEDSLLRLTGKGFQVPKSAAPSEAAPRKEKEKEKEPAAEIAQITDFRSFRKSRTLTEDDGDDFTS
jgi:hypothetical protein